MKLPFMNDQCEQMLKICNEFVRLQVSYDEYLCMKVLLLLSTGNRKHFTCKKKKHHKCKNTSHNRLIMDPTVR